MSEHDINAILVKVAEKEACTRYEQELGYEYNFVTEAYQDYQATLSYN